MKTHCKRGHPYDAGNTYYAPGKPDVPVCRTCHRATEDRYHFRLQLKKQAAVDLEQYWKGKAA